MGHIDVTITTTPAQDLMLAWLLVKLNAARQFPLPDVPAVLVYLLSGLLDTYEKQWQTERSLCITDALTTASPRQWAKVAEILNVKVP